MSKSIASIAIEKQDTMAEISYMRTIRTPDEYERPIFKWVGGKFSELPTVLGKVRISRSFLPKLTR